MSMTSEMKGPRLEFVVYKLPGTVERETFLLDADTGQNTPTTETVEAGYMVFTPMGSCQRLSKEQLSKQGYNREPVILSRDKAAGSKGAAGEFVNALTETARKKAWAKMEREVISACIGKGVPISAVVANYNSKGKVNVADAA